MFSPDDKRFRSLKSWTRYVERYDGRTRRVSHSKARGYYYQALNKRGVIVGFFFTGGVREYGVCNVECRVARA